MEDTLLTKKEEDALLQCNTFSGLMDRALGQLEMDDYYGLTMQLREVESAVYKLVVQARARIYAARLRTVVEKHEESKKG